MGQRGHNLPRSVDQPYEMLAHKLVAVVAANDLATHHEAASRNPRASRCEAHGVMRGTHDVLGVGDEPSEPTPRRPTTALPQSRAIARRA
jgi:hypothetical protein